MDDGVIPQGKYMKPEGPVANHLPPDLRPKGRRLVFHTVTAGIMAHGFFGLNNIAIDKHIQAQYGGFFQYLTIVGLLTSGLTMVMSSMNDLLPQLRPTASLKRALLLFSMPIEIVVAGIYWPLVLFAPHLMFPPSPDLPTGGEPSSVPPADLLFRIPLWMDLSMHAVPCIALLIDFFCLEKRYQPPATTIGAPLLAVSFASAYATWIEHCGKVNGMLPYPFLNVMDLPSRLVFYAIASVLSLLAFWTLNALHR